MEADDIGAGEQLLEVDAPPAALGDSVVVDVRVGDEKIDAERFEPAGGLEARRAETDDADGLPAEFGAPPVRRAPAAASDVVVRIDTGPPWTRLLGRRT